MVTGQEQWDYLINQSQCTLNAGYRSYPKILYFKSNAEKVIYFGKHLEKTQMKWRDLTLKLTSIIMF